MRTVFLLKGNRKRGLPPTSNFVVVHHASAPHIHSDGPWDSALLPLWWPMRAQVVDMFGAGLPAAALAYPAIGELVSHEHNGLLFASPDQLAQHLLDCFRRFPPQVGCG